MEYSGKWSETWNSIVDSYRQESDRAAAILAAAFADEFLKECIQSFLIDDASIKKLFEGYSSLSSFSARIDVAYALGLMTQSVQRDLNLVRKVRNHFAHHPSDTSFDISPVRDYCSNLSTAQESVRDDITFKKATPRKQYLSAIGLAIVETHNIRVKKNKLTIPYAE